MKPAVFIGSAQDDLRDFPRRVRRTMGVAINDAQIGGEHPRAKALKGFGGRNLLEIVDAFDGNAFRAVYTVRFARAVYVLHAFQKKATRGIATGQHDMALVRTRLKAAEAHYAEHFEKDT